MIGSIFSQLRQSFFAAERWYQDTPERSINDAYKAAIAIKRLEDEHFDGQPINLDPSSPKAISSYFQAELNQNLRIIRNRLATFKVSRFFIGSDPNKVKSQADVTRLSPEPSTDYTLNPQEYTSEVETSRPKEELLRKLAFIDSVIAHYDASISQPPPNSKRSLKKQTSSTPRSIETDVPLEGEAIRSVQESFYEAGFTSDDLDENPSQLSSGSFIPRSILRTASRFRKELNPDPDMEEEIMGRV